MIATIRFGKRSAAPLIKSMNGDYALPNIPIPMNFPEYIQTSIFYVQYSYGFQFSILQLHSYETPMPFLSLCFCNPTFIWDIRGS